MKNRFAQKFEQNPYSCGQHYRSLQTSSNNQQNNSGLKESQQHFQQCREPQIQEIFSLIDFDDFSTSNPIRVSSNESFFEPNQESYINYHDSQNSSPLFTQQNIHQIKSFNEYDQQQTDSYEIQLNIPSPEQQYNIYQSNYPSEFSNSNNQQSNGSLKQQNVEYIKEQDSKEFESDLKKKKKFKEKSESEQQKEILKLKNFYKNILTVIRNKLLLENTTDMGMQKFIKKFLKSPNLKHFLILFKHLQETNVQYGQVYETEQKYNNELFYLSRIREQAKKFFSGKLYHMIRNFKSHGGFANYQIFYYGCLFYSFRESEQMHTHDPENFIPNEKIFHFENSDLDTVLKNRMKSLNEEQ